MDLQKNFSDLITECKTAFLYSGKIEPHDENYLWINIKNEHGVYVILRKDNQKPIYIGSSGKISKGNILSGSNVKKRICGALTPYKVEDKHFYYEPSKEKDENKMPLSYGKNLPLADLEFHIFYTKSLGIVPACLEHLLIQGCINEFGDLPEANQKI